MLTTGQKISKVRMFRSYSQEYMGMRLGISQTAHGKIERSGREISSERLANIAKILGMGVQQLLSFAYDAIDQDSLRATQSLSDQDRQRYELTIKLLQDQIITLMDKLEGE